jgi:predicted RNase H-like HicB family nuclease
MRYLCETIDEAVVNVKEAIEFYIESLKAHGETIPSEENTFEYSVSVSS